MGSWPKVQRNVADNHRRACGVGPGPVTGVAVMTDTDNTGKKSVGDHAGIRIDCGS